MGVMVTSNTRGSGARSTLMGESPRPKEFLCADNGDCFMGVTLGKEYDPSAVGSNSRTG